MHTEITDPALRTLVERFYGAARRDALLGPVFNGAIDDWPAHFERLTDFWSSVMLTTGRYKGNPFGAHRKHPLTPQMFERWLALWGETADQLFAPQPAALLKDKAARIGDSLQQGLFFRAGV